MPTQTQPSTTNVNQLLSGFTDILNNHKDVVADNLQAVKDIMASSSQADQKAAIADDTTYSTSGIAGPALGGLNVGGLPYGNADSLGYTFNDSAGNQASIAKGFFNYPRPFVVDHSIHNLVAASGGSLPSGHTSKGFSESLYLAYIFPERYQQIMTRASEYGEHRIVNGVHYPIDVISGRMVAEWNTARLLDPVISPGTSGNTAGTATSVRAAVIKGIAARTPSGTKPNTIAQQADSGPTDRFSDAATDQANWSRRLTYGLPNVGTAGQAMVVPAEAPYLLTTRLPYLSLDQIAEVLRTTALPSGVVMDNGNGWARIDLYRAAGGYGSLDADTTVTMDAAKATDDTTPGSGFNAAATWSNDIGGVGTLTKNGSGVLTLSGKDTFAGIQLQAGGVDLTGVDAFTGSTDVAGGTLSTTASALTLAGDFAVDAGGALQVGTTRIEVGGAFDAQGAVDLLGPTILQTGKDSAVAGVVSGPGSLTKSDATRLTLSGANLYSGGTVLGGGTLDLAGATSLNADGSLRSASAGTGAIAFGAGAGATLRIENAAFAATGAGTARLANTVSGVQGGDTIDLAGLDGGIADFDYGTDVLAVTGRVSGVVTTETMQLSGSYDGELFAVAADGSGGTAVTLAAVQAPTLGLADDTGSSAIDLVTRDATLTGRATAGVTLTFSEGGSSLGTATAGADGLFTFSPTGLAQGSHAIAATEAAGQAGATASLAFTYDDVAPNAPSSTVTAAQNAGPTPIGVAAPSDDLTPVAALAIVAGSLPTDGTVTLADGTTPVAAGQTLMAQQVAGLEFTPTPGAFGQASTFTYTVADAAGNTVQGTAALNVGGPGAPTIAGTHAVTTAAEAPVAPFAGVTVSDPSSAAGATETLAIQFTGGGGALADGTGYAGPRSLSGGNGAYQLTGTAEQVTRELDALSFTPAAGMRGTTARAAFVLTDRSTSGTSVSDSLTSVADTAAALPAPVPVPVPTPTPTPAAVSLDADVTYSRGSFTVSGQASSSAGVGSVEISARIDGVATQFGAATVNADGTFTFSDRVGAHTQGFITATETDQAGRTAESRAGFSLMGGLPGGSAEQDLYSVDGDAVLRSDRFTAGGARFTSVEAPGQAVELQPSGVVANHHQGDTTFVYSPKGETGVTDVIGGFKLGGADHDTLVLPSSDFGNFADVLRHTGDVGGSALVTDPRTGDAIRLAGVTTAELKAHPRDFTFQA